MIETSPKIKTSFMNAPLPYTYVVNYKTLSNITTRTFMTQLPW